MTDISLSVWTQPGSLGFILAALGYFAFWILQLTVKTQTAQKYLLSAFTFCSVVWSGLNVTANPVAFISLDSFVFETVHKMLLAFFLLAALSRADVRLSELFRGRKCQIVVLIFISWLLLGSFVLTGLPHRLMATLLLTVVMLAMIEALYRQSGDKKWQFKPLIIAFGICLLLDFYLLAEAALLGKINAQTWQARGYVHLAMLPFLVVAVKRIKSWGINVYVSRDIVLHSSMVMAAGAYLCVLAVVGYYLSYVGGDWTTLVQAVFVMLGTAIFATLVFSGAIRRKYKVFIEKHFFANTFDYREKWVELSQVLKQVEVADQNAAHVCLQAWCQAIGYSDGALVKINPQGCPQVLSTTSAFRLNDDELAILLLYRDRFQNKNWLLDFQDPKDPVVAQLLAQQGCTRVGFSLLLPIFQHQNLWGCCLLTPTLHQQLKLNWELRDYLNAVTEQISSYLFMSEASKALSESAQFMAFSRMSAFVVHDLKNIKAQIDMLLKNAKKHRHNPEFVDDAFETIEAMQSRLQNMLSQLTNKQTGTEQKKRIQLGEFLQQLVQQRCSELEPVPTVHIVQDGSLYIDAERFANILFHLIDNAQQATAATGFVRLQLQVHDSHVELKIVDSGCGMSAEFIRDRLFKPFDTTKGNAGMGIGAYDALTFVQSHEGQLTVQSEPGIGTTFTLQLPIHSNQQ